MKRIAQLLLLMIVSCMIASCAQQEPRLSWEGTMSYKLKKYTQYSKKELGPYFAAAGVKYPPKQMAFLIFKNTRTLELYARDNGSWRYIRSFPVLAAAGSAGPKLHAGDRQVPEGIYHVIAMNPHSRFNMSLQLNYPNAFDMAMATQDGRKNLGDDIFIHGDRLSVGCVAVGDETIEQLFPLVYYTGFHRLIVIIAPNDLRTNKPIYGNNSPRWLSTLYASVRESLGVFPEPNTA